MTTTTDLVQSIDARLDELAHEITVLEAARSALNGNDHATVASAPADSAEPVRTRAKAPRRRRRVKSKRATEVVPAGKLEVLLNGTDGLTTTALTEQTNGDRDQVLTLLRELEAAGRVRRTGERRSTRWHMITDEDRIEERAAQLASQSRDPA